MKEEKNLRKTYKLKEATVGGLVDKLIGGNYISLNEADEVRKALAKATENMNDLEVAYVINTLNKRIDAPNSELITSAGFNYSGFENALKETSNKVKEKKLEKLARENKELEGATTNSSNDKKEKELSEAEKIEIDKNKESIDRVFNDFFEMKNFKLDKETEYEIAKGMMEQRKYQAIVKELISNGMPKEEAHREACKTLHVPENYFESPIMNASNVMLLAKESQEFAEEKNISKEEAIKILCEQDPDRAKKIFGSSYEEIKQGSVNAIYKMQEYLFQNLEIYHIEQMKKRADNTNNYKNSKKYFNISDMKLELEKREKEERKKIRISKILKKISKKLNKEKTDQEPIKQDELFEKLKNEYLTTNQSISDIYNKYKYSNCGELSFEEVLQGIENRIKLKGKSIWTEENLRTMMANERKIRIYDEVFEACEYMKNITDSQKEYHYYSETNIARINSYKKERSQCLISIGEVKREFLKLEKEPLEELEKNTFDKSMNDQDEYEKKFVQLEKSLKVETIESIIQQNPNVAAIASKNGVTNSRIKNAFNKIKNLFKSSEKKQNTQEQEEQQTQSVEGEEITQ